ncbi:hypothetical protein BN1013_00269 [Candidatus Rubidus massiliensis]|nr:hypothetical protein BN1013_00269 [Candidatus Rubidus massiliensis]
MLRLCKITLRAKNKPMKCIYLLFIFFPLSLFSIAWQKKDPDKNILAEIVLPKDKVTLDQNFQVILKLQYPITYRVYPEILKSQLMDTGFYGFPPFALIDMKETTEIDDNNTLLTLQFTLSPYGTGKFPITFFNIPFFHGNEVFYIATPFLKIFIEPPLEREDDTIFIEPLMDFSHNVPMNLTYDNKRIIEDSINSSYEYNQLLKNNRSIPFIELLLIILGISYLWFLLKNPPKAKLENLIVSNKQILTNISQIFNSDVSRKEKIEAVLNQLNLYTDKTIYQAFPHLVSLGELVRFANYDPTSSEWDEIMKEFHSLQNEEIKNS